MITQQDVKDLFIYENGLLIRKIAVSRCNIFAVAGYPNNNGYFVVNIGNKKHYIHRLVWLYHYGYLPEQNIDHIDRDRQNNRIENLREASQTCNMRNTTNRKNNSSGVKGVVWCGNERKWKANIFINYKNINLGYYEDFIEAVCHRLAAEQFEDWAGCDSNSPAFQYVKKHIAIIK